MIIKEEDYLAHYGILRRSGRYPWGSGGPEVGTNESFLGMVEGLKAQGMSETEIAEGLKVNTTELRAAKSIARAQIKQQQIIFAQRLKDAGNSNVAIAKRMGIPEPTVRTLLAPGAKDKADVLETTSNMLKAQVAEKGLLDIGSGVENHLGISQTKLSTAVARLREEGYEVHSIQVDQLGTKNKTTVKVLAPPGTTYKDVVTNKDKIGSITNYSDDGGRSYLGIQPPIQIKSSRVSVRYAEQGGTEADGVIYVRPGVDDVSIGSARYAQVRIAVDGTHYLKGMAIYKDDLPAGVDLQFNTNKKSTGNKLDAMKSIKDDPDNPFGSTVHQITDPHTKKVTSVMNIVGSKEGAGEEGSWDTWSKSLSSQFLSKQSPALAKTQLDMTFERKQDELKNIMALTNPEVRKKLLDSYADDVDASAVHLKAAALPRQENKVILPIPSAKPDEIYAPTFNNGEKVVLVRHPHGGVFEIPELTVNNRNPEAKKLLGAAKDAVGIHPKVAERLSGADFDGDTVLVIPNGKGVVKTAPALEGLTHFDNQKYKIPEGSDIPRMTPRQKGREMGNISNLITDMTIQNANNAELARAVRHSMVVIDAEKHNLDYKQSALDNGISALKVKYQGSKNAGAATLVSRATSRADVAKRKLRSAASGGPIDKATGAKVFVNTNESFVNAKGKTVIKTERSQKLAETSDAHTLSSGTPIEKIYADHSNKLKGLANEARLASDRTKSSSYSPSAKTAYADQVRSLDAKLNVALKNAPRERQARLLASAVVSAKRRSNPDMDAAEVKKINNQALTEARIRTGAAKERIVISDAEWAAIQAGAISSTKLNQILNNADLDTVKKLATPKTVVLMTSAKTARAKQMANSGFTQAEIASQLGVSVSTLKRSLE